MAIVASCGGAVGAGLEPADWQEAMRRAVRDPRELCTILKLPGRLAELAREADRQFPLFAPREFIARMRVGDPQDPLLRQVLPRPDETRAVAGYSTDPVGDREAHAATGLLRKYAGRALLMTTGACAIHCRYCFRRHYPYDGVPHGLAQWQPALAELSRSNEVDEVLLSGGDPLTLVDRQLGALVEQLQRIPHIRRLRIHTRLPVVIPQRICDSLLNWIAATRLTVICVLHINHPAELDRHVDAALARLVDAGVPLLNQSVLLGGVNDQVETLAELSRRLVDRRVLPYYLHQMDRVAGAWHFDTAFELGPRLIQQLRQSLPGYAVPRLAREVPGAPSKVVVA